MRHEYASPSKGGLRGRLVTTWRVIESCALDALREMSADSVDAVVTDPPYGLGFMGKEWDSPGGLGDMPMRRNHATNTVNTGVTRQGGRQRASADFQRRQARDARAYQEWCEAWAMEALRVLKPSALAVVFGGTRTYHRLVSGMEDAGFEIRDQLDWLYGSGFPKHPSALKPAHEPIVLARKAGPRSEPLNIDACRIEGGEGGERDGEASADRRYTANGSTNFAATPGPRGGDALGRWPANVIVDEHAAAIIDEQSGERPGAVSNGSRGAGMLGTSTFAIHDRAQVPGYADTGGASRFFYCAKPDSTERNVGLDGRNPHPTVKPVELMRWLIRLVTSEGGVVLDPFMGSGTTGIAALREGRSFIGIEREAEYVRIARARIFGDAPLLNGAMEMVA